MKKLVSHICIIFFMLGVWHSKAQTEVFINEIHYDNTGSDLNEAIEIAGPAGTDLTDWSVLLYNGTNGTVYTTTILDVQLEDTSNGIGFYTITYPTNGIQNGAPDGITLVDETGTVIQFLSYEGVFTATDGAANGLTSTAIGITETSSTALGQSLQLTGMGTSYEDFTWATPQTQTYGTVNTGQSFGNTPPPIGPLTRISTIQGTGAESPLINQLISIEGIVIGDFQERANGFYVQEEDIDTDNDPLSSEGIFIFAPNGTAVSIGDKVKVSGTVTEFFNRTEINNVTAIEVISKENPLPTRTELTLPVANEEFLERYEGMYVHFNQELTVTNTFLLGRAGELTLSSMDRIYQPTQVVQPGQEANDVMLQNQLHSIIIDDASTQQNPEPIIFPMPELTFTTPIRAGYTTTEVTGILTYAWSGFNFGQNSTNAYRVYVTEVPVFNTVSNPRTTLPSDVGGTLKIASFNVLNYFNGDGQGGGFPTPRGADTPEEFERQRIKIINAILAMDADVIGLMEIENDGYATTSAIQDLVNGLNASGGTYAFVNPEVTQIGTDAIAVGFLYDTTTVILQGNAAILDASIDPLFNDTKNRPALAQTFMELATGETVTVCVNHLKSKGSDCDELGDPNTGDGQGNCNLTRTNAAIAIANWLTTDPTASNSSYTMIIGDLNAYAQEDPIQALENVGYINTLKASQGVKGYSYSFNGQWGTLDYAMTNEALHEFVTGVTAWHINADEAIALDYNTEFKSQNQITSLYGTAAFRASDHDPIIVGLALQKEVPPLVNIETAMLENVSSQWIHVTLKNEYTKPVIIASVVLSEGIETPPVVTRIQNVTTTGFDIKVQNPSDIALSGYQVHYLAVEEGTYTQEEHGITMEAYTHTTTKTARHRRWKREQRTYQNHYKNPVVIGQLMSTNDTRWSVFWASAKNRRFAPNAQSFYAGKHVGEDYNHSRADETIGYMVVEAGAGSIANIEYTAGVGEKTVRGIGVNDAGFEYPIPTLSTIEAVVVATAGMQGNNGGWPVITEIDTDTLLVAIDEDQLKDKERRHSKEGVSYVAFGTLHTVNEGPITSVKDTIPVVENTTTTLLTQKKEALVYIYPNPNTSGILHISLMDVKLPATYFIKDFAGNTMTQGTIDKTELIPYYSTDISAFKPGVYILKVIGTDEYHESKIIIRQ